MYPAITVNPRCEKKLRGCYPWIYANEITAKPADLADVELVLVKSPSGCPAGTAYWNRHSLIQARLLAREAVAVTEEFFRGKIAAALQRRSVLYPALRSFRLVYGESDGLPGLIVDKYEGLLVVELNTQGMYRFKNEITAALAAVCNPETILLQNNSSALTYEGLAPETVLLYGAEPHPVVIEEFGVKFLVDPVHARRPASSWTRRRTAAASGRWRRGKPVWTPSPTPGRGACTRSRRGR
jgi:23S rRNA (cytosine1962-C5)-methyltransferase